VAIRPGGPQINTQQLLVSGALDMALAANSFDPLNAVRRTSLCRGRGLYQKDPQILLSHPRWGSRRSRT